MIPNTGAGVDIPQPRLLKLRHDHHDLGFASARIVSDSGAFWTLRVESPGNLQEYLDHLHSGASMSVSMVTRDGRQFRGDACVSTVSVDGELGALVVLAGVGPLHSE